MSAAAGADVDARRGFFFVVFFVRVFGFAGARFLEPFFIQAAASRPSIGPIRTLLLPL